mmetsp:Transcript_22195/g.63678  ORF Transcript_22195/g.63678 Transcript_22195/m.63678 type:complete len:254 (+) Transcript_22195:1231-1992(+)
MSPLILISRLSSTTTRIPLRDKASATEEPMKPPPTTTASLTFGAVVRDDLSIEIRAIKPIEGQAECIIAFLHSLSFCLLDGSSRHMATAQASGPATLSKRALCIDCSSASGLIKRPFRSGNSFNARSLLGIALGMEREYERKYANISSTVPRSLPCPSTMFAAGRSSSTNARSFHSFFSCTSATVMGFEPLLALPVPSASPFSSRPSWHKIHIIEDHKSFLTAAASRLDLELTCPTTIPCGCNNAARLELCFP